MKTRKITLFAVAFALAVLFTCEKVPDYCGDGMLYDPGCEFCFGNRAYVMCGDGKYNPLTSGCDDDNKIGKRCSDGSVVPLGTPCGGYILTIAAVPEIGGTLVTHTPPNDGLTYAAKQEVTLAATANSDYKFADWAGAQIYDSREAGNVTTAKHLMNSNMPQITILAVFKPIGKGKLITAAFPKAGGTVSRNKEPEPGSEMYKEGEAVTVTASPAAGYTFVGWAGADSSKRNPITVVMDESKTLVAMFTPIVYALRVSVEPAGGGAVYINGSALRTGDVASVGMEVGVLAKEADGYKFVGWSGSASFVNADSLSTIIRLTADAAITARFERGAGRGTAAPPAAAQTTFTLTVDKKPEGGSVSLEPDQAAYISGTQVAATATADAGYEFVRWTGADTGTVSAVMIYMTGNKTLSAEFRRKNDVPPPDTATAAKIYTVTFNANGGSVSPASDTTKADGTLAAALPVPTRAGYNFDGWFTADGAAVTAGYKFSSDATVSARWTEILSTAFTITFDANGGTVSPRSGVTGAGGVLSSSLPTPVRDGYTSSGWYTSASGGTTVTMSTVFNQNTTIYARWTLTSYTINYTLKDGTVTPANPANYTVETQTFTLRNPSKPNNVFTGWTGSNGNTPDTSVTITVGSTGNKNYTANYRDTVNIPTIFTITFNANYTGGTVTPASAATSADSTLSSLPTPTRTGYSLLGWYTTAASGGSAVTTNTKFTANATIYARWTLLAYNVRWNADGGAPAPTQTSVNHGDSITAPAAMTKIGYTFGGWYTDSSLTTAAAFPITGVTKNTTLYAKWTVNPNTTIYTVIWNADGGSPIPDQSSVAQGGSITAPAAMTKTGYTFGGWYTNSALTAASAASFPITGVTANTTLYAKWTTTAYTITYDLGGGTVTGNPATYTIETANFTLINPTKSGSTFAGWTGANGTTAQTSVTIAKGSTGDKSYTANWTAVTYAVTVTSTGTGATGGGSYAAGETVSISAGTAPSGQQFKNWTTASSGVTFADASSAATTFTMPASAVAVTAVFEAIPVSKYLVTVSSAGIGVTDTGSYAAGATVTITAGTAPAGQQFKNWTTASAGVTFANASSATTTFTMPANAVTVTANFEAITYAVTVTAGTGATGGGNYAAGTPVSISAGTAPAGQVFKNWTTASNGVTFANANNATTTFPMPSNAVTVTAVFGPSVNYGTLNDSRDSKTYKTVEIGSQTWMAANLNYQTTAGGSWCYEDRADSCAKYGRLYDWETAMTACPSGWHLPSRVEWGDLAKAAGGTGTYGDGGATAGKKLKSTSGWNSYNGVSGNGTDDYGFSALPGGYYYGSSFYSAGNDGHWWTATEGSSGNAYYRGMYYSSDNVSENDNDKSFGFSVRCVKGPPMTYAVTVSSTGMGATGGGSYAAGVTVSINAGTAPTGQVFKNWTTASAGVTFADANNATTTFTMPENAVTVTANFGPNVIYGTLNDSRDDKTYTTVEIGTQTWMAANLNYQTTAGGSWCYENSADSCTKYGRLYDWETAMTVCPSGWHLPSRDEWGALVAAAGGFSVAGSKLKSTSGWYNNGNGTDTYGFSALPGGVRYSGGTFDYAGDNGYWWTATEGSGERAYYRHMHYDDDRVYEDNDFKSRGFAVRCLAD